VPTKPIAGGSEACLRKGKRTNESFGGEAFDCLSGKSGLSWKNRREVRTGRAAGRKNQLQNLTRDSAPKEGEAKCIFCTRRGQSKQPSSDRTNQQRVPKGTGIATLTRASAKEEEGSSRRHWDKGNQSLLMFSAAS